MNDTNGMDQCAQHNECTRLSFNTINIQDYHLAINHIYKKENRNSFMYHPSQRIPKLTTNHNNKLDNTIDEI